MRQSLHRPAWSWSLAGALCGVLVTLVLQAPARWATAALQQVGDQRLVFQDPQGTVWNGSARLTLTGGAGSQDAATLPGRVGWRIRPDGLGVRAELSADCCLPQPWQIQLSPKWGGVEARLANSLSQWPALWLVGLGTPWNTVRAEGRLALTTQDLVVHWTPAGATFAGRLEVDALQMASRLSTIRPMGSYRITVLGGSAPALQVQTMEGSLQLSGAGRWLGSRLRFEGVATAAPEHLDALANLLNILGRRDGARTIIKFG